MTPAFLEKILDALRRRGVLLKHDAKLPSVTALVAGAPIKGSWWGHAKGREIFWALEAAEDHPDVAFVKLVAGKDTLVHRKLWPSLLSVASSRQDWQLVGLSKPAHDLLAEIERRGTVLPDRGAKDTARELEARLLAFSAQFHTESGAHAKRLESWAHWAKRVGCAGSRPSFAQARKRFEGSLDGASWPWSGA